MGQRTSICTGAAVLVTAVVATIPTMPAVAASTPRIVINELNYHPEDDDPASEFIELLNTTGSPIDVSGWCVDGIDLCFPGGTRIAGNGYLVRTGAQYGGRLSNGGEDLTLTDRSGATVDFVEYDDKGAWPGLADGEGQSLQRRDPTADSDTPGNWESHPPTPGARNLAFASGLNPSFDDVEHTELPAPGTPIEVTGELTGATSATLRYRVGFGPETAMPMTVDDGTVSATIPGQAAGSLIRYRLTASSGGRNGSWPRQGDGSTYRGTTVARNVATRLPVFEIFMSDADFDTMSADLTLRGDNGYPMVFAYEGQVFDNARIRVKGQTSRTFPKKKYKIILPPGYDLEDDDLLADDVDEWGMHSSWIDKSFLRETLASEFMTAADARGAQQAFPVRFERNNQFLGLYTYVEQPDGTYRDRYGVDDAEVYEVGPDNLFGLLSPRDPTRSQEALRARYDKETFEYLGDDELRRFIATVNSLRGASEREWFYDNVDIPSVVNILAASMVIQNQDFGVKNYRLVFDEWGRIGIMQNDYDLTFGRRWSDTYGAFDQNVYVGGFFEHPGGPFFETFFTDPQLLEMIRRRIRTLTEEQLNPVEFNARVSELASMVRPEAVADRAIWGTYRSPADPTAEAERLVTSFIAPQYERLLGPFARQGRVARNPQPAIPRVFIEDVKYDGIEHVIVRSISGDTVDLSGFEIPEIDFEIPGGTVLLPGQAVVFAHEDAPTLRNAYVGFLVGRVFEESLTDAPRGISLLNRDGDVVDRWDLVPPGQLNEIAGEPGRSGLVSIVATETDAAGFLQVLPCDDDPGSTSNLNADGPGQTRSALALTRFDAGGTACIYNMSATHVVADLQGYFADGSLDDIDDERLLDSRSGSRPVAGSVTTVTGGRPDSTGIVSIVATDTIGAGFFSVVPCGSTETPTSNLNFDRAGQIVATLTFVRFDAGGEACIFTNNDAHMVVDVQGYLAADAFDDISDERLVDTRTGAIPDARSVTVIEGRPGAVGVVSLIATETRAAGFLQVLPCATTPGATSNINYDRAGATSNGLTTVQFGSDGTACVYTHEPSHIVADLQGYFAPDAFDDLPDRRVLDTRS